MTRTETSALAGCILLSERSELSTPAPLEPLLRVCEKLRGTLSKFLGTQGYEVLLMRALARAIVKAPLLGCLGVSHPGILELRTQDGEARTALESDAASVDLVCEILDLLFLFIGTALTRTLVEKIWPDIFSPESSIEKKEGT